MLVEKALDCLFLLFSRVHEEALDTCQWKVVPGDDSSHLRHAMLAMFTESTVKANHMAALIEAVQRSDCLELFRNQVRRRTADTAEAVRRSYGKDRCNGSHDKESEHPFAPTVEEIIHFCPFRDFGT